MVPPLIKYPRFTANDVEQLYMVFATPQELLEAGYIPTVSTADTVIIWRK